MTAVVLRKELHEYIDTIPARNLATLKPMLSALAEPPYIIEPASPEECAMVEKRMKDYENDPSSFTPWSEVKKELKKLKEQEAKDGKRKKP